MVPVIVTVYVPVGVVLVDVIARVAVLVCPAERVVLVELRVALRPLGETTLVILTVPANP